MWERELERLNFEIYVLRSWGEAFLHWLRGAL
jgi:hypothetical protein